MLFSTLLSSSERFSSLCNSCQLFSTLQCSSQLFSPLNSYPLFYIFWTLLNFSHLFSPLLTFKSQLLLTLSHLFSRLLNALRNSLLIFSQLFSLLLSASLLFSTLLTLFSPLLNSSDLFNAAWAAKWKSHLETSVPVHTHFEQDSTLKRQYPQPFFSDHWRALTGKKNTMFLQNF